MNRVIKFRAWDKEKNKFEPYFVINQNGDIYFSGNERIQEQLVLMQYTGILDKNDKEIYEGDIVDCQYLKPKLVEYSPLYGFMGNFPEGLQEELCEVIGNIYENPELLSTLT